MYTTKVSHSSQSIFKVPLSVPGGSHESQERQPQRLDEGRVGGIELQSQISTGFFVPIFSRDQQLIYASILGHQNVR